MIIESRKDSKAAKTALHVCARVMMFATKRNPEQATRGGSALLPQLVRSPDGVGVSGLVDHRSCRFSRSSVPRRRAFAVFHANGTTDTPSNANVANIAHASLTLQTKAAFSIIGRTQASATGVSGPESPLAN